MRRARVGVVHFRDASRSLERDGASAFYLSIYSQTRRSSSLAPAFAAIRDASDASLFSSTATTGAIDVLSRIARFVKTGAFLVRRLICLCYFTHSLYFIVRASRF